MIINITERDDGRLLRDIIRTLGVSRKTLVKLKSEENGILLNGKRVTVRAVVRAGDVLTLGIEDTEADVNPRIPHVGTLPEILYEDSAALVLNKPAGMPTHPSFGHIDDSLAGAVIAHYAGMGVPFVFRAVNRLDKDTSGTVLVAKNRYHAALLSGSMANGLIKKKYIAVLDGDVPEFGRIEGYISRVGQSIIKRKFSDVKTEGAEYSLTEFCKICGNGKVSVVSASPVTGRTHQLRVHFASLGAPVYGDGLYGTVSPLIGRQALHAFSLAFPFPDGNGTISVNAPLPDDIRALADSLGIDTDRIADGEI